MLKFLSKMYAFESLAKNRIVSFKVYLILFFSYLLALLIPLLSITLFFNMYFTDIFKDEILTGNLTNLQQVVHMVNSQMDQIEIVKDQIKSDQTIKRITFPYMPTQGVRLIQNLRNRIMVLPFITEAFLYFHEDEYAFSSESSYSLVSFYNKYKLENCTYDQFRQMINSTREKQVIKAKDQYGNNMVMLMYSLPEFSTIDFNYNKFNRTLMFVIPDSVFVNALEKRLADNDQNTYILDQDGNMITSTGSIRDFKIDNFNDYKFLMLSNKPKSVTINNAEYFITSVESDVTSWRYVSFISAKSIADKIVTSKFKYFWFIALVLTFGIAAVLFLTTISYRPVKKLKYNISNLFPSASKNVSEFEYVHNAIGNLLNENKNLQSDLMKQVGITKDYLFFRLLNGDVKTINEFNDMGKHAGVSISKSLYMVAVVYSKKITIDNADSFVTTSGIVKSLVSANYECFIKDHSGYNCAAVILAMDSYEHVEIDSVLTNIIKKLKKDFDNEATIGVGKRYTSLCEISKSYVEAMTATDFRHLPNSGQVIYFSKLNEQLLTDISYPFSLGQLKSSIIQYKKKDIGMSLISVVEHIKSADLPLDEAKCLCLGVLYHIVEYFNKLGDINPLCEYSDIFHLYEFDCTDDFSSFIDHLYNSMQAALEQHTNPEVNSIIIEMISYIKANYHMFDFSLQKMADQFNMPTSVISQYFKDYTDMNIVDYLAELRIQKAKELLLNSQMDIKNISVEVGYYNVNSFIRRFKQIEGITPGDYRKENTLQA